MRSELTIEPPTVRQSVGVASRLLRGRWVAVAVTILCVQAALMWTMPLLTAGVRGTLHNLGISGVNVYTVDNVLTSPLALLVLVVVAAVATLFVLVEMTLFAVIAHLALEDEPVTFSSVLRRSARTARKAVSWQGLLLVPYLAVLLPISGVGFSSVMTERIALPDFIAGELLKTTRGGLLYAVVMGLLAYSMLRLLLFPAVVSSADHSIVSSLVRSVRMTTWRPLLGFVVVMLSTALVAFLVLLGLGAVGAVPVALVGTHTAAGAVLGLLELARHLVAAVAAAFVAFFFVVHVRLVHDLPAQVAPSQPAPPSARVASALLAVFAVLSAGPHVVAAADAAATAGQSSPVIIGHRGYPAKEVENSLAGLRAADAAGADLVEMDIQETRDGGFVVMHDVNLDRLTGVDRDVYELTTDEVTALTLRQGGRSEPVPTLAEFIREADELGIRLLVELKPHGQERPGLVRRLTAELNRLDPEHAHLIQSLDRELIEEIARVDPDRETAYVVGLQIGDLPRTSTGAVVIEAWSFHDGMLEEAHRQGREVYVWTVNDVGDLTEYLYRGVDGVITDEVGRAASARERLAAGPMDLYVARARGLVTI